MVCSTYFSEVCGFVVCLQRDVVFVKKNEDSIWEFVTCGVTAFSEKESGIRLQAFALRRMSGRIVNCKIFAWRELARRHRQPSSIIYRGEKVQRWEAPQLLIHHDERCCPTSHCRDISSGPCCPTTTFGPFRGDRGISRVSFR